MENGNLQAFPSEIQPIHSAYPARSPAPDGQEVLREQLPSRGHVSVQLSLVKCRLESKDVIGHDRHGRFRYLSVETSEVDVRRYGEAAIVRCVQRSRASWPGEPMTLAIPPEPDGESASPLDGRSPSSSSAPWSG